MAVAPVAVAVAVAAAVAAVAEAVAAVDAEEHLGLAVFLRPFLPAATSTCPVVLCGYRHVAVSQGWSLGAKDLCRSIEILVGICRLSPRDTHMGREDEEIAEDHSGDIDLW